MIGNRTTLLDSTTMLQRNKTMRGSFIVRRKRNPHCSNKENINRSSDHPIFLERQNQLAAKLKKTTEKVDERILPFWLRVDEGFGTIRSEVIVQKEKTQQLQSQGKNILKTLATDVNSTHNISSHPDPFQNICDSTKSQFQSEIQRTNALSPNDPEFQRRVTEQWKQSLMVSRLRNATNKNTSTYKQNITFSCQSNIAANQRKTSLLWPNCPSQQPALGKRIAALDVQSRQTSNLNNFMFNNILMSSVSTMTSDKLIPQFQCNVEDWSDKENESSDAEEDPKRNSSFFRRSSLYSSFIKSKHSKDKTGSHFQRNLTGHSSLTVSKSETDRRHSLQPIVRSSSPKAPKSRKFTLPEISTSVDSDKSRNNLKSAMAKLRSPARSPVADLRKSLRLPKSTKQQKKSSLTAFDDTIVDQIHAAMKRDDHKIHSERRFDIGQKLRRSIQKKKKQRGDFASSSSSQTLTSTSSTPSFPSRKSSINLSSTFLSSQYNAPSEPTLRSSSSCMSHLSRFASTPSSSSSSACSSSSTCPSLAFQDIFDTEPEIAEKFAIMFPSEPRPEWQKHLKQLVHKLSGKPQHECTIPEDLKYQLKQIYVY